MNPNQFNYRGVLGGSPAGAPTMIPPMGAPAAPNYGPRTMFGDQGKLWNPPGRGPGEMNFGQFGGGNAYPFQPFLPAGVGVGGFGGGMGGMSNLGFNRGTGRGLGTTGGQGMNNFPGVLSGGFNRRGY